MRWLIGFAAALACASPAAAQEVLWLSPSSPIEGALELELASRGLTHEVIELGSVDPEERARLARGLVSTRGARVAVWIEDAPRPSVHAVGPGAMTFQAPLPTLEPPRLVAMVAASLVDEALMDDVLADPTPPLHAGAGLSSPRGSPAAAEASVFEPPSATNVAPYLGIRVSFLGLDSPGPQVNAAFAHSIEAGVQVDRLVQVGLELVGPILVHDANGMAEGTAAFGGGLAASLRGSYGELELRMGVGASLLLRGAPDDSWPSHPHEGSVIQLGGRFALRGMMGARLAPSFALLGGASIEAFVIETREATAVGTLLAAIEWF
jgi:hypothetical protein